MSNVNTPAASPGSVIAIFAKPPLPGKTKSRLSASVGADLAARIAAAMLLELVAEAVRADARVCLFHTPDAEPEQYGLSAYPQIRFFPQHGNGLGERLGNASAMLFEEKGHRRVIFLGGDCPTHTVAWLESVFALLENVEVVIQPAEDGGYVLLGTNRHIPALFHKIDWGTGRVYQQTIATATQNHLQVQTLNPSFDIDRQEDLHKLAEFRQRKTQ